MIIIEKIVLQSIFNNIVYHEFIEMVAIMVAVVIFYAGPGRSLKLARPPTPTCYIIELYK